MATYLAEAQYSDWLTNAGDDPWNELADVVSLANRMLLRWPDVSEERYRSADARIPSGMSDATRALAPADMEPDPEPPEKCFLSTWAILFGPRQADLRRDFERLARYHGLNPLEPEDDLEMARLLPDVASRVRNQRFR